MVLSAARAAVERPRLAARFLLPLWLGPALCTSVVTAEGDAERMVARGATAAVEAAGAENVALRVRDDGRVDVRATSAPIVALLERVAERTGMSLSFSGTKPLRRVTVEVYASSQAQAVVELLDAIGLSYAATFDPGGHRVVRLVVAEERASPAPVHATVDPGNPGAEAMGDDRDGASPQESPDPGAPEAALDQGEAAQPAVGASGGDPAAADDGPATGTGGDEGFPLVPGDYVPGGRASGQPTEWGTPDFVLPEPVAPPAAEPVPEPTPAAPAAAIAP